MIEAIVTDIEGTTSSLSFVKDELFPYARQKLAEFVRANRANPEVAAVLEETAQLAGETLDEDAAIARLIRWIDEDRKFTPLKLLQGLIWEAGYRAGALRGHIYADAVRKLRDWRAAGIRLYIYSSGSVQAQKLLFGHTAHGDLTPLLSGYFDTRSGVKQEADSYQRIAGEIGLPPQRILFLSDSVAELDAARSAGFHICWLVREWALDSQAAYRTARSFDEIAPDRF
jgi:enolase-phosphatase E1